MIICYYFIGQNGSAALISSMDLPPESLAFWIGSEIECQVSSYRWMVFLLISVQKQDDRPPSITLKFLLRPNIENTNLKSRLLPGNYDHKCYNRSPNMTLVMCYPENSVRTFTVSDAIYPQNLLRWRSKINRRAGTKRKRKSHTSWFCSTAVLAKTAIHTPDSFRYSALYTLILYDCL